MGQNFSSEPVVEKDTERGHDDRFHVAVSSCQGWRTSQEDNHCMMLELPDQPHSKAAFFAVFDGHGSAKVSKHASERLWKHLIENENYNKGNFKDALEQAFLTFDQEVNESYNAQLAGTTAICLLIINNMIYCANIGDSRAVASVNCECVPLSFDHKPENPQELKRILAAGGYVLGNRVNGNLALSRAFGDFHYKNNDQLPPEMQIVSPQPDVKSLELNDNVDFLLLACDGIWDVLSNEEVIEFVITRLEHNMDPGLICEQLTTRCLATDYELVIGCDNMTVLLICFTRGRTWADYCTDIFQKNCEKLGERRDKPDPNAEIPSTLNTGQRTEKQRSQLEEEHEESMRQKLLADDEEQSDRIDEEKQQQQQSQSRSKENAATVVVGEDDENDDQSVKEENEKPTDGQEEVEKQKTGDKVEELLEQKTIGDENEQSNISDHKDSQEKSEESGQESGDVDQDLTEDQNLKEDKDNQVDESQVKN